MFYEGIVAIPHEDPTENVTLTYDQGTNGKGRLTGKTGQGYSYSYTYTIAGQIETVTQTIDTHTFITAYAYDDSGILTGMTYPDGRKVSFGLDSKGQYLSASTSKSGNTAPLISLTTYKPFGPLSGLTFGNNIPLARSFNQDYILTDISAGDVQNLTYERDLDGRITDIVNNLDSSRSQSFTYNDLNRLATATGIYGGLAFTYDAVGNRLSKTENNATDHYAYIPGSNTIEFVAGDRFKGFGHDDNGNISFAVSETTVAVPGLDSEYLYNSDGQRIRKTADGLTVYYHYDLAGNLIAQSDSTGTLVTSYIYMGGMRIATVATDGTICYYHTNHLETPEVMTDQSGAVVWKADYKPFGEAMVDPASTVVNDFRFPGQYYDSETGLHYNWNRYYDPGTGRYLTADPIGLKGGINPYVYAGGNPINAVDPWGLCEDGGWKWNTNGAIAGAIGGAVSGGAGGALVGSAVPGLGTLAGGLAGAIGGAISGAIGGGYGGAAGGFISGFAPGPVGPVGGAIGGAINGNMGGNIPGDILGGFIGGVVGGAVTGAISGSIIPGAGTLGGAIIGGIVGGVIGTGSGAITGIANGVLDPTYYNPNL